MPADLDELFAALAAHADAVPTGTADRARRAGQRRHHQRVTATALASLLVLGVAAVTAVRVVGPYVAPTHPRPTVTFTPLTLVHQVTGAPPDQVREITVLGSRLFVLDLGPAGRSPDADTGPTRLDALDLTSMAAPFDALDLGSWHGRPTLLTHQQALVLAGKQDAATPPVVTAYSPATGARLWTQHLAADDGVLVGLTAALVDYEPSTGVLRALDWASGDELWRVDHAMNGTRLTAVLTAPTLGASTPAGTLVPDAGDPRLVVVDGDGSVAVLDARTGSEVARFSVGAPVSAGATYVPLRDRLYVVTPDGVRADRLDGTGSPVQLLAATPTETVNGVVPCGERICVTIHSDGADRISGVDPGTGTEVWRVRGAAGTAVDGRVLSGDGELYDLSGGVLRGDGRGMSAWWLTPGSVLLLDAGFTRDSGNENHAVLGMSTVDGSTIDLGQVAVTNGGCQAALQRYLMCGTVTGVDVWQFATG